MNDRAGNTLDDAAMLEALRGERPIGEVCAAAYLTEAGFAAARREFTGSRAAAVTTSSTFKAPQLGCVGSGRK